MALSTGEAAFIRAERARTGLQHTFTRTTYTVGPDDSEGNATRVLGTSTTGLACRYRSEETLRTDLGGRTTIYRPNLSLPHDSPLAVGDLVSAITNSDGVVLLAGPLAVESVTASASFGPTLSKRAYLRAGDVR
jgi:hypothetical protein